MPLTSEWRKRIERWSFALKGQIYQPLGTLELGGFVTLEKLTIEQARKRTFVAMPEHTAWGALFEYGWFHSVLVLPETANGKDIAIIIDTGGEGLLWINESIAAGFDREHREVLLCQNAKAGSRYELLLEAYAGDGWRLCDVGPVPFGSPALPPALTKQRVIGKSTFGVWDETLYQTWIDVQTLLSLRDSLRDDELRVAQIDAALCDFTVAADLELPFEQMKKTVAQGREILFPLLMRKNGDTVPKLYAFGHAHLDLAWLWPMAETERKIARTVANQLALLESYTDYKYLQSQPFLLETLRDCYPELFARLKRAVLKRSIILEGGLWVEADTNLVGGESLIRQLLFGKRYLKEEFGIDSELCWLPDVFGYSAAFPQILKGCGINYFATAKLLWAYYECDPFPYNTFLWEGLDGTRVLAHVFSEYSSNTDPASVIQRWRDLRQRDRLSSRLMPFGWGDGGGGPTREQLELLKRQQNLEGVPSVTYASPVDFFKSIERPRPGDGCSVSLERYVGELYYPCHRGTYTSQARTKQLNRKCELLLREAEIWGVAARHLTPFEFTHKTLEGAWKKVLLHQFHDILPGSAIERVYAEAARGYQEAYDETEAVAQSALATLCEVRQGWLTIFNSLGWRRRGVVEVPQDFSAVKGTNGEVCPVQHVSGRAYCEIEVPACGWTSVMAAAAPPETETTLLASPTSLENEVLRLSLNARGEITSIVDKESGFELLDGTGNVLKMYKDVPSLFDAWDIDSMYQATPVALPEPAHITVSAHGPLWCALRVERVIHHSTLIQEIVLYRQNRRIDFRTTIDWHEKHKLLKVCFPVRFFSHQAIHHIQFGHLCRPNHRSRQRDADRYEVCNHYFTAIAEEKRGCAVLNDGKYGVSVEKNQICLSLLRSPLAPDMNADQGAHGFTYAFYVWNDCLARSGVVREGYQLNIPLRVCDGVAAERALFEPDSEQIILETIKPAEDGSRDIVLRLYESYRSRAKCILKTGLPVEEAYETDMLEQNKKPLTMSDEGIQLEFRPFEIKTIRIYRKNR